MRPSGRRRILLIAALLSMGSHWLVLKGVELDDTDLSVAPQQALLMTTIMPPAPDIRQTPAPRPAPVQTASEAPAATEALSLAQASAKSPSDESPKTTPPAEATEAPSSARTDLTSAKKTPETPHGGQLQFQVFLGDGDGDALALMQHTIAFHDGRYELSSRGEAVGFLALVYSGLLTQHSSGVWDSHGFSTRLYSEQRGKKPENRVNVDLESHQLVFSNGTVTPLSDLHILDRLSVIYQLGLLVRDPVTAGRPPPLQVLSSSSQERWQFVRIGQETLQISGQSVPTTHYRRQSGEGQDKGAVDLWFDAEGWPAQIRLTDKKGTVITQRRSTHTHVTH